MKIRRREGEHVEPALVIKEESDFGIMLLAKVNAYR
jgi:hypothetical protein